MGDSMIVFWMNVEKQKTNGQGKWLSLVHGCSARIWSSARAFIYSLVTFGKHPRVGLGDRDPCCSVEWKGQFDFWLRESPHDQNILLKSRVTRKQIPPENLSSLCLALVSRIFYLWSAVVRVRHHCVSFLDTQATFSHPCRLTHGVSQVASFSFLLDCVYPTVSWLVTTNSSSSFLRSAQNAEHADLFVRHFPHFWQKIFHTVLTAPKSQLNNPSRWEFLVTVFKFSEVRFLT